MAKNILITGGAGFIGSSLVRLLLDQDYKIAVLDALTYAGSLDNLHEVINHPHFTFIQGNINDQSLVLKLLQEHKVDTVFHLAAESHVDNSISGPKTFIETNIMGTFFMLEAARQYWNENAKFPEFRFLHISTDEVFGQLGMEDEPFKETTPYAPNSPYSASKAGSDHLVRAWFHTYGLPVIITNCSNNFGPRQHREKLIPTVIRTALSGENIPIYGNGKNVRDWLYVDDHCKGLLLAALKGVPGDSYCLGGGVELQNIDIVGRICNILDHTHPRANGKSYQEQIAFVQDRPGHDWRYAIDCSYADEKIGYKAQHSFEVRLEETVKWYLITSSLSLDSMN